MQTKTLWELQYLGQACCLGIRCGIAYDLLNFLRLWIPHKNWLEGVEDFFFWVICGFWTFFLLFENNSGVVRGYILLAVLASMSLWYCLPSRFVMRKAAKQIQKQKKWIKHYVEYLKKKTIAFKMKKKQKREKMRDERRKRKENKKAKQNQKKKET